MADERDTGGLESPGYAVLEGGTTGSLAGPAGLVFGVLLGWIVSRAAKRRRS